jgi:hypothetical protein
VRLLRVTGRYAARFHAQHVHDITPKALECDEQMDRALCTALPGSHGAMMSHVPCSLHSDRKAGSRCTRVAVRHDHGSEGASCCSALVSR